MKSYGQFCPVAKAAELFCERWTPLIIRDLAAGACRFSELQRGVPLMSPTTLSRRLKQLEAEGVVERRRSKSGRSWTYHLTAAGEDFIPLVKGLGVWGQRWTRRQLKDREIDLGLLLWTLERSVKADAFGGARTTVRVKFTDLPDNRNRWWFVNEGGHCMLCIEDPGFEVGLWLSCTLPDMIHLVRGDLPLGEALASGRLEAIGETAVAARLRDWLNLSPLAGIASRRDMDLLP